MSAPTPRPWTYLYVVVDKRDPQYATNPTPVKVGLTRKECRDGITFDPDSDHYRIRRARATLYES